MGLELLTCQGINPGVVQQATVLQMNTQELETYIKELTLENPMAELEEPETPPQAQDDSYLRKLEWLAYMDEQNRPYYAQEYEEGRQNGLSNLAASEGQRLRDELLFQLLGGPYSGGQMRVFSYIADSLDDRGYFVDAPEDAAEQLEVTSDFFSDCLDTMRHLQPPGVCARDLTDCLLLQLEQMGPADSYGPERSIVTSHLKLMAKNQLPVIARRLDLPLERVRQAKEVIQSLNPKPAAGYSGWDVPKYIVPDVIVSLVDGELEVSVNDRAIPRLRLNQDYLRMLRDKDCEQDVRQYLLEKSRQVERAQGLIARRSTILERLAQLIAVRHTEFFLRHGAPLSQLRMWEAAEELQVHESTVSRTVKDKYLYCQWGTFPLEYFFSKSYFNGKGNEAVGAEQVIAQIKRLIDGEDKKRPYSDQKLTDLLSAQGIQISRRTVAKYRERMDIPDCRGRKAY